MSLSQDPERRAAQLANLRRGVTRPPEGNTRRLKSGLQTVRPPRIVMDATVAEIDEALAASVPLQGPDGPPPADRFAIELAAIALVRVRRCHAYLDLNGDTDEKLSLIHI